MKHSRTEVRHWRMLRQLQRTKIARMNTQLRRNKRGYLFKKHITNHRRLSVLFISSPHGHE